MCHEIYSYRGQNNPVLRTTQAGDPLERICKPVFSVSSPPEISEAPDDASEASKHLVTGERDVLIMKGNLAPASRRHFRFNNHEIIFDRAISETESRDIPPSSCPRY